MITGRDFIITGLQPWNIAIGSNAKDIAREIAKNNRVLYVNTPVDMLNYLMHPQSPDIQRTKTLIKNKKNGLSQITANLWTLDCPFCAFPVNCFPDGFLFDAVNRLNNKKDMQAHPIRRPRAPVHRPYTSDRQRYLSQLLCKRVLKAPYIHILQT